MDKELEKYAVFSKRSNYASLFIDGKMSPFDSHRSNRDKSKNASMQLDSNPYENLKINILDSKKKSVIK